MRSRSVLLFTALAALTLFLFLLDLAVGAVAVPLGDVWAALTGTRRIFHNSLGRP